MTNRILGILILVLVFGAGYLYYIFEYKPNMQLEKSKEEKEQIVEEKKEITLQKIELKKQAINLNKQEDETNLDNKENIEKKEYYSSFNLPNLGEFYFIEENNKLNLFSKNEELLNFDIVDKDELDIKEVIGNNNIFIKVGESKYLYNLLTKEIKKLEIKLDIEYIKTGQNDLEFLLKTPVGIFIYTYQNDEINYFVFFEDFIYFKTGYIGIINSNEETKLKNLDLQNETKNLIIFYDPNTKEKNILYRTDLKLNKIFLEQNKVFFEDNSGDNYELNNIY